MANLREAATEPPFFEECMDTDDDGLYHCDARANALSGSGRPIFTETVSPEAVELVEDRSQEFQA